MAPGSVGDMADSPRDAVLKQAPASRNEKAPADFGYVGIDSILEQMRRKAMKQGFEFNIMVVGECWRPLPACHVTMLPLQARAGDQPQSQHPSCSQAVFPTAKWEESSHLKDNWDEMPDTGACAGRRDHIHRRLLRGLLPVLALCDL